MTQSDKTVPVTSSELRCPEEKRWRGAQVAGVLPDQTLPSPRQPPCPLESSQAGQVLRTMLPPRRDRAAAGAPSQPRAQTPSCLQVLPPEGRGVPGPSQSGLSPSLSLHVSRPVLPKLPSVTHRPSVGLSLSEQHRCHHSRLLSHGPLPWCLHVSEAPPVGLVMEKIDHRS